MVISYHFDLHMPKAHASYKIVRLELFTFTKKLGYLASEVG